MYYTHIWNGMKQRAEEKSRNYNNNKNNTQQREELYKSEPLSWASIRSMLGYYFCCHAASIYNIKLYSLHYGLNVRVSISQNCACRACRVRSFCLLLGVVFFFVHFTNSRLFSNFSISFHLTFAFICLNIPYKCDIGMNRTYAVPFISNHNI